MKTYDYVVIGAGIAGAAFAARVAGHASVLVLESETGPGYHSTGRSAALYTSMYGNTQVQALSRASRDFLGAPPPGFAQHDLLRPRGRLYVGRDTDQEAIELFAQSPYARRMAGVEARAMVPVLRPEASALSVLDTSAFDIDVNALHTGFLRMAKAFGAELLCSARVSRIEKSSVWDIRASEQAFQGRVIVNAAGAWADSIARLAGVQTLGVQPLRRTAVLIDACDGLQSASWPAVIAADASYYFKPDAGLIVVSPCDETQCEPADVQPEELDIAIAIDRIEGATTLNVRRVIRSWAGQRSFASDRSPVIGYADGANDFFWLAGLGGFGVQTAPAYSELAASLAIRKTIPQYLEDQGVDTAALDAKRFSGNGLAAQMRPGRYS